MMKNVVILFLIFFTYQTRSQRTQDDNDDGQYHPDDEGKYIYDNSGQYIQDYSGLYHDDGTGRYNKDGSGQYRHVEDKYRLSKGNYASATSIKTQYVQPVQSNEIIEPVKYGKYDDNRWRIIKLFNDVKNDGFHWEYETENEIKGQEQAKIFNSGTKDEALRTKGSYQYTGADNKVYNIEYTADENGFVPRGNHLHPILQRAILETLNRKSKRQYK